MTIPTQEQFENNMMAKLLETINYLDNNRVFSENKGSADYVRGLLVSAFSMLESDQKWRELMNKERVG